MKHHLTTLAILIAALAMYAAGLRSGATLLGILGGLLELWFWVRVLRPKPGITAHDPQV